jgi:hypothetical protein
MKFVDLPHRCLRSFCKFRNLNKLLVEGRYGLLTGKTPKASERLHPTLKNRTPGD